MIHTRTLLTVFCMTISFLLPGAFSARAAGTSSISHVIVVLLDNTHLDDVAQMPHVQAFLRQGTVFDHDQSVLESRTQPDMTSFIAGAYPDKTGVVDQEFFDRGYPATYSYWENHAYVHLSNGTDVDMGHNYVLVPNPWKPFNDRGWDVGVVEGANMTMENVSEVRQYHVMNKTDTNPRDYVRYAIHCAGGSANCADAVRTSVPDSAFGLPNIPWLSSAPLLDNSGTVGPFCPNPKSCFSAMSALSATYAMQTHGVRMTYAYIDAPHDGFDPNAGGYRSVLAAEDHAFDLFFTRLAGAGITPSNTLFVLTSDEGDQFSAGGAYQHNFLGALSHQPGAAPADSINITSTSGPLVYIKNPADVAPTMEALRGVPGWQFIAGPAAMHAIHNSTAASPEIAARQPSFILFGEGNTWWNLQGKSPADQTVTQGHTKWIHGTVSENINTTWIGFVGPGILSQQLGTFVDQVDGIPTVYYLLGWPIPQYMDGRVLLEAVQPGQLLPDVREHVTLLLQLADAYKQINAPLGAFSLASLNESTVSCLEATSAEGKAREAALAALVDRRDALVAEIRQELSDSLNGNPVDQARAQSLLWQAQTLMNQVNG